MISLMPGCVDGLNFWKVNLLHINGVTLWPIKLKPSRILYSHAPISACCSFIILDGKLFHQNWSDFERCQSSTFVSSLLSLQAIFDSLRAQITRMLYVLWTMVLRFQLCSRWLLISIAFVFLPVSVLLCNGSLGTSTLLLMTSGSSLISTITRSMTEFSFFKTHLRQICLSLQRQTSKTQQDILSARPWVPMPLHKIGPKTTSGSNPRCLSNL